MPLWSLNAASYALLPQDVAYCAFVKNGEAGAAIASVRAGSVVPHAHGFSTVRTVSAGKAGVALAGLKDDEPLCIAIDPAPAGGPGSPAIVRRSSEAAIDAAYISRPSRLEIPGTGGPVQAGSTGRKIRKPKARRKPFRL